MSYYVILGDDGVLGDKHSCGFRRKAGGAIMMFNVLGPLEILLSGQQVPLPRRAKERCLLAVLLMEPNRWLRPEGLIYRVWDDGNPPDKMRATFRSYMSHVKDVLQGADTGARLESGPDGYLLQIDRERIDLHRFRQLKDQAGSMAQSGDAEVAASLLREAEQLWRGPALAGLSGRWVESVRVSMEEERRAAALKRIGLELELGRHAQLTGELQRMSAEYPLDETVLAYSMTALYGVGRQADALDLYRKARDRLTDVGIEPGPMLSELQRRILRRDPALGVAHARERQVSQREADHLPPSAPGFVGRAEEMRVLADAGKPGSAGLTIIDGMPGVGKTALAIEAARRVAGHYPDGQMWVTFHAHEPGEMPLNTTEALRRLLEMAGVPFTRAPRGLRELATLWQHELASRRMVIVLDDVPDQGTIAPLLPRAGPSLVIITTRSRLRLPASSLLTLDVLPVPDAVTLFTQTAGMEKIDNPEAVTRAVRLCGCLPLAVRLAASRLRDNGPSTVSEFVESFAELHALPDGIAAADQQLTATFELSYRGLAASQQRIFRYLGMIPCSDFTAETAAVIADVPVPEAKLVLSALLERHLIERAAPQRYRFHDLLRAYAESCARLRDSDNEYRDSVLRLLDYLLYNTDRADRLLYPHRQRAAMYRTRRPPAELAVNSAEDAKDWLESEWRNLMKAADFAAKHEWHRHCAELAHVIAEFLDIRGCRDEAIGIHSLALQACRDMADSPGAARASLDLSLAGQQRGNYKDALRHAVEAQSIYRATGDRRGQALAADRIGTIHYYSGRFREALAYDQEARKLYNEAGDRNGEADAIFHAGVSSLDLGRPRESMDNFDAALALFDRIGNTRGRAKALNSIAEVKRRQGYHREALRIYQHALYIYNALGARQERAVVEQNIGNVYLYKGVPDEALRAFRNALATYRDTNDLPRQARAMCDIGDAYLCMDRHNESVIHYQRAAEIAEQIGDPYAKVVAFRGIADSHRASDRPEEAMKWYKDALKLEYQVEDPYQQAKILEGIAETMFRTGELDEGRIYLRQAHDLYQMSGSIEAASTEIRLQTLDALRPP